MIYEPYVRVGLFFVSCNACDFFLFSLLFLEKMKFSDKILELTFRHGAPITQEK